MNRKRYAVLRDALAAGAVTAALALGGCRTTGQVVASPIVSASPTAIPKLQIVTPTPGVAPANAEPAGTPGGAAPPPPTQTGGQQPGTYVVKSGDTLYAIAVSQKVSVEALMQANGISDPNDLQVGQVLVIPEKSSP